MAKRLHPPEISVFLVFSQESEELSDLAHSLVLFWELGASEAVVLSLRPSTSSLEEEHTAVTVQLHRKWIQ